MGIVTGALVFLISWWMVFFIALPIGIHTQDEVGEVAHGTVGSAPSRPRLLLKAGIAIIFACIFTYLAYLASAEHWILLKGAVPQ